MLSQAIPSRILSWPCYEQTRASDHSTMCQIFDHMASSHQQLLFLAVRWCKTSLRISRQCSSPSSETGPQATQATNWAYTPQWWNNCLPISLILYFHCGSDCPTDRQFHGTQRLSSISMFWKSWSLRSPYLRSYFCGRSGISNLEENSYQSTKTTLRWFFSQITQNGCTQLFQ